MQISISDRVYCLQPENPVFFSAPEFAAQGLLFVRCITGSVQSLRGKRGKRGISGKRGNGGYTNRRGNVEKSLLAHQEAIKLSTCPMWKDVETWKAAWIYKSTWKRGKVPFSASGSHKTFHEGVVEKERDVENSSTFHVFHVFHVFHTFHAFHADLHRAVLSTKRFDRIGRQGKMQRYSLT